MSGNTDNKPNLLLLKLIPAAVITIGVMIFLFILFSNTNKETEIVFSDTSMEVKGMFGASYNYNEITSVELKDSIPAVTRKNNGAAIGDIKKGDFEVEGLGECKLFILSKEGPFLFIKTNNTYIIINYADKNKTEKLYADLQGKIKNNP